MKRNHLWPKWHIAPKQDHLYNRHNKYAVVVIKTDSVGNIASNTLFIYRSDQGVVVWFNVVFLDTYVFLCFHDEIIHFTGAHIEFRNVRIQGTWSQSSFIVIGIEWIQPWDLGWNYGDIVVAIKRIKRRWGESLGIQNCWCSWNGCRIKCCPLKQVYCSCPRVISRPN